MELSLSNAVRLIFDSDQTSDGLDVFLLIPPYTVLSLRVYDIPSVHVSDTSDKFMYAKQPVSKVA